MARMNGPEETESMEMAMGISLLCLDSPKVVIESSIPKGRG